jgi:peptidoglycan/LPS O-acetylase OafA/YrhL
VGLRIPGRSGTTLEVAYSGRDNAFNFMRLCFALLVIIGHAGPVGWGVDHDPMPLPVDTGAIAVAGFFGLSGFLISRSGRRSRPLRYIWHRVLRIFPGYWVCLIATAFVLAPLLWIYEHHTTHGFRTATNGPVGYVLSNFFTDQLQNDVAGVVFHQPFPYSINGSLWTLKDELTCYVLVLLLAVVGVLRRARWVAALLGAALFAVTVYDTINGPRTVGPLAEVVVFHAPVAGDYLVFYMLMFGLAFVLGMLADLYRSVIPMNDVLGVLSLVVFIAALWLKWPVFGPAMPAYVYLLLWLGMRLPRALRKIGRRNDYSYGVYIYAFPIQQALAVFGLSHHGIPLYLGTSLVATVAIAMLSWHGVEKPAMRLKDWNPSWGRRGEPEQPVVANADVPPAAHPAPILVATPQARVPAPRSAPAPVPSTDTPLVPIPRAAEADALEPHDR